MFFGSSSLAFFQKRSSAQGCSVVLPHCSDSFECDRVLGIQLEHVEVAQLGFVVVARFKIIVGLGNGGASFLASLEQPVMSVTAKISVTILNRIFDVCICSMISILVDVCVCALFCNAKFFH